MKLYSLHGRFIAILLITASAMATLSAWVGYEMAYRSVDASGRAALNGLITAIEKTAAVGAYAHDKVLMQELVDGIERHPLVDKALIINLTGDPLASGAAVHGLPKKRIHSDIEPDGLTLTRDLKNPFDAQEIVGRLLIHANVQVIQAEARKQAVLLGLGMVALIVVLALVLNWVVLRNLSRPMARMARELVKMEPGTDRRVSIAISHERDEIGTVVEAVNRLLEANQTALARERDMRAEIAEMEAQYRQIFDFTSAGIFVLTRNGHLINSNPTISRIIGTSLADMVQLRDADFIDRVFCDPRRVREMIVAASVSGDTASADLELRRIDGQTRWVHCLISVQGQSDQEEPKEPMIEGVIYDVTQRKTAESAAVYKAEHDALTGLKNRAFLETALTQFVDRARVLHTTVTVVFIDLDGFKRVNDELGHDAGDQVLIECAARLHKLARRNTDLVGRLGGDELILVLDGLNANDEAVLDIAQGVLTELSKPIDVGSGRLTYIGASIGIASYPEHALDQQQLLRAADKAMYEVKRGGKNAFRVAQTSR